MNCSGWIRGMMTHAYGAEEYLIHVGKGIEHQLKEWDEKYEVNIMKFADYIFVVKHGETYYEMTLTEDDVVQLKSQSPFSLDRRIWMELKEQGLPILMGYGNYLDRIFK